MKLTAVLFCIFLSPLLASTPARESSPHITQKIQVAILLDVSNSMDGLIDQAKTQIWKMVNVLGKARGENNYRPEIEIALYEYGRSSNKFSDGYVKLISPFTTDLDMLSKKLFSLKTMGGNEFCGHAIYTSVADLDWHISKLSYKTIFIAGNEDFLQGSITYIKACEEAMKKDIIINTIYCGDKQQGILEHWNLNAECGNGSYSNIDQNEKIPEIVTPYDRMLFSLNDSLNDTYVYYGADGEKKFADQSLVDDMNTRMNKTAALERVSAKANRHIYNNSTWDLVDAFQSSPTLLQKIDAAKLPLKYRSMNRKELEDIIKTKSNRRTEIQRRINTMNKKREQFIETEVSKAKGSGETLQSAIEKSISEQARRFKIDLK